MRLRILLLGFSVLTTVAPVFGQRVVFIEPPVSRRELHHELQRAFDEQSNLTDQKLQELRDADAQFEQYVNRSIDDVRSETDASMKKRFREFDDRLTEQDLKREAGFENLRRAMTDGFHRMEDIVSKTFIPTPETKVYVQPSPIIEVEPRVTPEASKQKSSIWDDIKREAAKICPSCGSNPTDDRLDKMNQNLAALNNNFKTLESRMDTQDKRIAILEAQPARLPDTNGFPSLGTFLLLIFLFFVGIAALGAYGWRRHKRSPIIQTAPPVPRTPAIREIVNPDLRNPDIPLLKRTYRDTKKDVPFIYRMEADSRPGHTLNGDFACVAVFDPNFPDKEPVIGFEDEPGKLYRWNEYRKHAREKALAAEKDQEEAPKTTK